MAQNTDPEVARAAQDVEAPAGAAADPKGPTHYGRGGAANIIDKDGRKSGEGAGEVKKSGEVKREEGKNGGAGGGLLAKGKEILGKLGKK